MKLPHIRIARSNYSSAVTKYPSKVRGRPLLIFRLVPLYLILHCLRLAFPFVISQEDAIVQLGPYASRASVSGGLLGSLGARFLPGFGFKPLQPTRIQPVYLPAWFVDAEVEAKAVTADNEGQPVCIASVSGKGWF
jgi:hypothetical protein